MSGDLEILATTPNAGPWQVLIVTDSLVEQKLLSGLLIKYRHRVTVANGSRDAHLKCSETRYDVVVLDPLLSDMDGSDFIRDIRIRQDGSQTMPIIVMSEDPTECDRCRQAGASACLTRPLRIAEFHESVLAARRPASPPGPPDPINSDFVDWQIALDAVGGRRDLLAELVTIFETEYPVTLSAIRAAIDGRDPSGLQMSSPQLKGCLRYFGRTTASELASTLEDIGRSGQIDGASSKLEPLAAAVQRLLPKLRLGPD